MDLVNFPAYKYVPPPTEASERPGGLTHSISRNIQQIHQIQPIAGELSGFGGLGEFGELFR